MQPVVAIAVAVDDAPLREMAGRAARRAGADTVALDGSDALTPQVAAVVCAFPSQEWDSCVASLLAGAPVVPHVLLLTSPGLSPLVPLLSAPSRVRNAVADVVTASADVESRLLDVLTRLVKSSVTTARIAQIQDLVAGEDRDLRSLVETVLTAPIRHTTLEGAIRSAGLPRRRVRRHIRKAGFAPATQFLWMVRTLGAHGLLRDGATVKRCASSLGYRTLDTLRRHFANVLGMTPSAARELPLVDLTGHLRRTRDRLAG